MIKLNGFFPRSLGVCVFALIDGFLIMGAIFAGEFIRFSGRRNIFETDNLVEKILLIVFVIQTTFYYFDLYETKNFREKIRMGIRVLKALAVSCILLTVVYFSIPFLAFGRGIFTISFLIIFAVALLWRIIYPWLTNKAIFKERVLIIGTGILAQRIQEEILKNGHDGFEIVGYIGENEGRENIEHKDYREFQPDLFHLRKSSN